MMQNPINKKWPEAPQKAVSKEEASASPNVYSRHTDISWWPRWLRANGLWYVPMAGQELHDASDALYHLRDLALAIKDMREVFSERGLVPPESIVVGKDIQSRMEHIRLTPDSRGVWCSIGTVSIRCGGECR